MSNVTKLRFQTPELQRRFEAAAENAGVDRLPNEVAALATGLARFGTTGSDGVVEISASAFEQFSDARMQYEQRLDAGLASYARQHPVNYVLGNLGHELAENFTFGLAEGGEEFRRKVANFSFSDFPDSIDQKK